jgi:SPX domain protein involved in polyphosphate accumulation
MKKQVQDQPLDAYRYERKLLVERMDAQQIRALVHLHPAMFVMPYPPRWVNNIYLDTPDLSNYLDNVEGAVDRRKVRLRWYHALFGHTPSATLEFKIKRGMVGRKVQFDLGAFRLDEDFTQSGFSDFLQAADLPPDVKLLLHAQIPVLVNRYRRWYYATTDGRFRVTVDTGMCFHHINPIHNTFRFKHVDHLQNVVELKYQKVDDPSASRIASAFPFSVFKNSKYVLGMESVYW